MGDIHGFMGVALGWFSVFGGFAIAFYAIWQKSKHRELRHREHMAMIEKGLLPPQPTETFGAEDYRPASGRRNSGVMLVCTGIAMMMFFGLSSGNWKTVWIGGFILMFGVAQLITALLDERDQRRVQPPARPPNSAQGG